MHAVACQPTDQCCGDSLLGTVVERAESRKVVVEDVAGCGWPTRTNSSRVAVLGPNMRGTLSTLGTLLMTSVSYTTDDRRIAQSCLEMDVPENKTRIAHVGREEMVYLDVTFTPSPDGLIPSYYVSSVP